MNLDGSDEDPGRRKMANDFFNVISKDSPTEQIKFRVEFLTEIKALQKKVGENASSFSYLFNGTATKYVNKTGWI